MRLPDLIPAAFHLSTSSDCKLPGNKLSRKRLRLKPLGPRMCLHHSMYLSTNHTQKHKHAPYHAQQHVPANESINTQALAQLCTSCTQVSTWVLDLQIADW